MGLCESENNSNHTSDKKNIINPKKNQSSYNNKNKNLFCSPIGSSNYLNQRNMSLSQTQLTIGNQSNFFPPPKLKPYVYNNNYNSKYSISSNGINANSFSKGYSKLNNNSLSISNSYGELIIENQINPEMKENKDFKEFFDSNDKNKDIITSNNNINNVDENGTNKTNKKNLNLYHQFRKKNSNTNLNKNNKNTIFPIPLDSE